jgi:P27 family predicted phage terminase small subunit
MKKHPKPPETLSPEAQKLWKETLSEYEIDDVCGRLLLTEALTAYDEVRKAEAILKRDGLVVLDRYDRPKQHPATMVLRDSRNLMLRCLKQLNLDVSVGNPLK